MMFLGIRKKYWIMLGISAVVMGMIAFFNYSSLFAVQRVTVVGPHADRIANAPEVSPGNEISIFRYDRGELARTMLASGDVENVRISLDLPYSINAAVNQFRPVALLLLDHMYGIDSHARIVPYDSAWESVDLPVVTGVSCTRPFDMPTDFRLAGIVSGLIDIRDRLPHLYRQIAEIDLTDHVYVIVHLTTGSARYRAHSLDFATQLEKLAAVVNSGTRSDDGCYNLTYDGIVIKEQ